MMISFKHMHFLLIFTIWAFVFQATTQRTYTFTVYVDEGRGDWHGHVWIGLSDGTREGTFGLNPQFKELMQLPEAMREGTFRGLIEDESGGHWDVKKPYSISNADYHRALEAVRASQKNNEPWCPANHCGDWAKHIADIAGVKITLPWYEFDRPSAFSKYLREHGGILNANADQAVSAKDQSSPPKDTPPAGNSAWCESERELLITAKNGMKGCKCIDPKYCNQEAESGCLDSYRRLINRVTNEMAEKCGTTVDPSK